MRAIPSRVCCLVLLLSCFLYAMATAQRIVPPNSKFDKRGTNSGSNTGASVVKPKNPAPVTVTYTAVSPERAFTNLEGKGILAQLLAFSAPAKPGDGPVEVIRDGKILLLVSKTKKPVEYPLENLSDPDQDYVNKIAHAAENQAPEGTKAPKKVE